MVGATPGELVDRRAVRHRLRVLRRWAVLRLCARVGAGADAAVFFAGSLFFTSAAALQSLESVNVDRRRLRLFAFEPVRIDCGRR